jgi:hypothetical protein
MVALDLGQSIALGFIMFVTGFSIGFYYLKHKFESSVAGVFDFESGEASGSPGEIEDLLDEFEEEGDIK